MQASRIEPYISSCLFLRKKFTVYLQHTHKKVKGARTWQRSRRRAPVEGSRTKMDKAFISCCDSCMSNLSFYKKRRCELNRKYGFPRRSLGAGMQGCPHLAPCPCAGGAIKIKKLNLYLNIKTKNCYTLIN